MRPGLVAQESVVAGEINNPACVNNKVLSATSDSGIYVTGIVNHSVTCILLDTGATVSVLNEGTWKKSGLVTKIEPVIETLTTANGNELTVLGQTKVRFRLGNIDCFWPVMIARGLSHDCILGSDFFQHFQCQIHYLFIYLFIYRFVQCTGERTIGHVVPYLVHPPKTLEPL